MQHRNHQVIRLTRSKQTLTVALFLSAKRIALSFEGTPDVPADLRKRELVVPAHSYGQRFCKRSIEEEVALHHTHRCIFCQRTRRVACGEKESWRQAT